VVANTNITGVSRTNS